MEVLADDRGNGVGLDGDTQQLSEREVVNHLTAIRASKNAAARRETDIGKSR